MVTPERKAAEEEAAQDYAEWIYVGGPASVWVKINAAIIERWSVTALQRIKRRAWQIVETGR